MGHPRYVQPMGTDGFSSIEYARDRALGRCSRNWGLSDRAPPPQKGDAVRQGDINCIITRSRLVRAAI